MGRSPIEWPIPTYVVDLRERVILTFRVPGRVLAERVPGPVQPDLAAGKALVCLALGGGRCLKPVGGAATLASEFHTAELFTPVRWQGACRPAVRGHLVLEVQTDSPSLTRLLRTVIQAPANCGTQVQGVDGSGYACALSGEGGSLAVRLPRGLEEQPWPEESVFASAEAAEIHLLHPEGHFVHDPLEEVVRIVPVHEYARRTSHVRCVSPDLSWVTERLGLAPADLILDHAFVQKRCTHTWSFPPERVPVALVEPRGWSLAA